MQRFTIGRYADRIARLVAKKKLQTDEKRRRFGIADEDDYGYVLPPEDFFDHFQFPFVDEKGSWSGPMQWAANFKALCEVHPLYYDEDDAIAGKWMFMMSRLRAKYKLSLAPFKYDYSHLKPTHEKYDLLHGIGKDQHFAPDYNVGLELGWSGLKAKVRQSLVAHTGDAEAEELLKAELEIIEAAQIWIRRTAESLPEGELRDINFKLIEEKPETFHEVIQWIAWYNMIDRTYNRAGSGGALDEVLYPYYERDVKAGILDDETAIYYIACLLLNDPHYYNVGGPNKLTGKSNSNKISYMILDAAHALKLPGNITVPYYKGMDQELFRRGVEILLEDNVGLPRFSGNDNTTRGFMKLGYPVELGRERVSVGCNWMSLMGKEYTMNDVVKINMAKVFTVAFDEICEAKKFTLDDLYAAYVKHMHIAMQCIAEGLDFHLDHQWENEPELILNLLCYGPIEKGRDMSHGGAMYYNLACDGAGMAVVADSFAALEQQIVEKKRLTWEQVAEAVKSDYAGTEGEAVRRILASTEKYGYGDSCADHWAHKLTQEFAEDFRKFPTPRRGLKIIPGLFSWADTVRFGKQVPATPNGRKAFAPISHGANPLAGFRKDGAVTAIAEAVAGVQCNYGSTCPLQLEIDSSFVNCDDPVSKVEQLLATHFELGGTLVNINLIDLETLRKAHKDPDAYPGLVVRVTGFTAYFRLLSPEFRQLVVNRVLEDPA